MQSSCVHFYLIWFNRASQREKMREKKEMLIAEAILFFFDCSIQCVHCVQQVHFVLLHSTVMQYWLCMRWWCARAHKFNTLLMNIITYKLNFASSIFSRILSKFQLKKAPKSIDFCWWGFHSYCFVNIFFFSLHRRQQFIVHLQRVCPPQAIFLFKQK